MHHSLTLTSRSRIGSSHVEPAELERQDVQDTQALNDRLRAIDGQRLRLAQLNWDRFNASANPPGALAPDVARDSLTRHAIRRKELRRKALRSGRHGLFAAIAAA